MIANGRHRDEASEFNATKEAAGARSTSNVVGTLTPAEGDRRRHERVPVRLLVKYGTVLIDHIALIGDLSEGGLFIQTHEFYPVGTRIQMVIEFRGRSVRHRGKVRWATRAPDHLYDSVVQGWEFSSSIRTRTGERSSEGSSTRCSLREMMPSPRTTAGGGAPSC